MTETQAGLRRPPVLCGDGCGALVEQPLTGRPKRFLNDEHRRNAYRQGGGAQLTEALLATDKSDPPPLIDLVAALTDAVATIPTLRESWRTSSQLALESQLAALRRRAEDLEAELAQAHRATQRADEDARLAVARSDAMGIELTERASRIEELTTALNERDRLQAELGHQLLQAKEREESATAETERLKVEARHANQVAERLTARADDLDGQVTKLRDEADGLRGDLDQARAELTRATAATAQANAELRVEQQRRQAAEELARRAEQAQLDTVNVLVEERRLAAERLSTERDTADARLSNLAAEKDRLAHQLARLTDRLAQIAERSVHSREPSADDVGQHTQSHGLDR